MTYRTEQILRALALAGVFTFAISNVGEWTHGILLGIMVWILLVPFTASRFVARSIPTNVTRLWKFTRLREEQVPHFAIDLAKKLGARPPKVMKVLPGSHFNAAVDGNTLYVTEGLKGCLRTRMAVGIIAHEMGHLAGKHGLKMLAMLYLTTFVIMVTVALIGESSWSMVLAVALTILPVSLPLLSRHLEYDADRRGASVVGTKAMAHTLRTMVDHPEWSRESDTHPSIERRLARLRKNDNGSAI